MKRARELPLEQRRAIVASCVERAKSIPKDRYEIIYHAASEGMHSENPIPSEFAPLAPKRVNVKKERASIKLYFMMDSGVYIDIRGLSSPNPAATLGWGGQGETEPWPIH